MGAPLLDLLENLGEGFLLVAKDGTLRYANPVARSMLSVGLKKLPDLPALKDALGRAAAGALALPASVSLEPPGAPAGLGWTLLRAPSGNDFALLVRAAAASAEVPTQPRMSDLANILALLRAELGRPLKALAGSLEADPVAGAGEHTAVRLRELSNSFQKLLDFAEVFGRDRIDAADRVVMKDLVNDVWRELAPLAAARKVSVSTTGFGADLPPVYGNRDWLRRAVRELLDNAVRHARGVSRPGADSACQIEINTRQVGPRIVMSIRNAGVGMLPKIPDRMFLPFDRVKSQASGEGAGLSIGLPLTAKLVELHGGRLKVTTTGEGADECAECVIELPTGAPQHDTGKLDLEQARRYAEDIGKLLSRRRNAPAAT